MLKAKKFGFVGLMAAVLFFGSLSVTQAATAPTQTQDPAVYGQFGQQATLQDVANALNQLVPYMNQQIPQAQFDEATVNGGVLIWGVHTQMQLTPEQKQQAGQLMGQIVQQVRQQVGYTQGFQLSLNFH